MKNLFDADILSTAGRGALGMGASTTGVFVSIMPQVEAWLRIISLLVGIAVGIVTLVSLIRKLHNQPKTKGHNEPKNQS